MIQKLLDIVEEKNVSLEQKKFWKRTCQFLHPTLEFVHQDAFALRSLVYDVVFSQQYGERVVFNGTDDEPGVYQTHSSHMYTIQVLSLTRKCEVIGSVALILATTFPNILILVDAPMYTVVGIRNMIEWTRPMDDDDMKPCDDDQIKQQRKYRAEYAIEGKFCESELQSQRSYQRQNMSGQTFQPVQFDYESGSRIVVCDGLLQYQYMAYLQSGEYSTFDHCIILKHGRFDGHSDGLLFETASGISYVERILRDMNSFLFVMDWLRDENGFPSKPFTRKDPTPEVYGENNVSDILFHRAAEVLEPE